MNMFRERLAEFPVTEWEGVRIRIIINHPDAQQSMTYEIVHDHRLMPLGVIRRPIEENQWSLIEYDRRCQERQQVIRALSEQLAAAVGHAMQRLEGDK